MEVKEAGVVTVVGMLEEGEQALIDVGAVGLAAELLVGFDAAVLADAQENEAVDGDLDGVVELARGEVGIAQGEVAGEGVAPFFDFGEKGVVHFGSASFLSGGDVFVEGTFEDGVAGEDVGDFVPAVGVLVVFDIEGAGFGGRVGFDGFDAAIVNGEFFEVGDNGEGQLGGPGIAAELEGRVDVLFDIDGRLFGFDEEFAGAADAEAIIGGGMVGADFDGVFVDDVLVGLGVTGGVGDVPAEGVEQGIGEFSAELGFVVSAAAVGVDVAIKGFDQALHDVGNRHRFNSLLLEWP